MMQTIVQDGQLNQYLLQPNSHAITGTVQGCPTVLLCFNFKTLILTLPCVAGKFMYGTCT